MMKINIAKLTVGLALSAAFAGSDAQAAKFTVLHSFVGGSSDGASPFGGVTPASHGGFYVATDGGGASSLGTLTLIRSDGTSQILHAFAGGTDGQNADGTPFIWTSYDGNLYGTTQFGGSAGCGTLYNYSPGSGAYAQLRAFQCGDDGAFPFAGLSDTHEGYLLATGYAGGPDDDGSLIYYTTDGNSGASCPFSGSNGKLPYSGVTTVNNNIYTMASAGGAGNLGVVIEYPNQSCSSVVLHNFGGGSNDGSTPYGTLLAYNNMLYGTTSKGGNQGLGVVFRMNMDGSAFTVLHAFQGIYNNTDGSFPHSGLTMNTKDGMLYGTTINGGSSSDLGTVFRINPNSGKEKVIHAFNGSDGAHPYGDLYIKKGTIYGTTLAGGASNLGAVFKLKP